MRLHTDRLFMGDIYAALADERSAGRIAGSVTFKIITQHESKSHKRAFEVQLESSGKLPGDGRRAGNSGSYGAMGYESGYAATHDEWGWFLAALYRKDWGMVAGSAKNPVYEGQDHFNERTGFTYALGEMVEMLESGERDGDHGDPYPWVSKGAAKAGRMGASRDNGQVAERYPYGYVYRPRTAAEYRTFAHLTKVTA